MKAVALDSGDYAGTYKVVGGEFSLDFVNTVSWPATAREHDWLDGPDNFTAWAKAVGILSRSNRDALNARPKAKLASELEKVRQIRAELDAVLRPLAFNKRPFRVAIEALNTLTHDICALRCIDPATLQWVWADPASLPDVLAPVVWSAAHVVTSLERARIGHCRSCNWIFHDTSRNRSRRWCDMADCGSRDKALRYYHRAKTGGKP